MKDSKENFVLFRGKKITTGGIRLVIDAVKPLDLKEVSGLEKQHHLIELHLTRTKLSKLENLENLVNLKKLLCDSNSIEIIENLDTLQKLEVLWLPYNRIKKISGLDNLVNLKELWLSENEITTVEGLEYLKQIQKLDLSGNKIVSTKGLQSLKSLKVLRLSGNKIDDLRYLENLDNLEVLTLEKNKIIELSSLSKLKNLKELKLASNKIEDISPLSSLLNLETLELWDNNIKEISVLENLKNLKVLGLGKNQIDDIESLRHLVNLEMLYLYYNNIENIDVVENLTKLWSLEINNNPIRKIPESIRNLPSLDAYSKSKFNEVEKTASKLVLIKPSKKKPTRQLKKDTLKKRLDENTLKITFSLIQEGQLNIFNKKELTELIQEIDFDDFFNQDFRTTLELLLEMLEYDYPNIQDIIIKTIENRIGNIWFDYVAFRDESSLSAFNFLQKCVRYGIDMAEDKLSQELSNGNYENDTQYHLRGRYDDLIIQWIQVLQELHELGNEKVKKYGLDFIIEFIIKVRNYRLLAKAVKYDIIKLLIWDPNKFIKLMLHDMEINLHPWFIECMKYFSEKNVEIAEKFIETFKGISVNIGIINDVNPNHLFNFRDRLRIKESRSKEVRNSDIINNYTRLFDRRRLYDLKNNNILVNLLISGELDYKPLKLERIYVSNPNDPKLNLPLIMIEHDGGITLGDIAEAWETNLSVIYNTTIYRSKECQGITYIGDYEKTPCYEWLMEDYEEAFKSPDIDGMLFKIKEVNIKSTTKTEKIISFEMICEGNNGSKLTVLDDEPFDLRNTINKNIRGLIFAEITIFSIYKREQHVDEFKRVTLNTIVENDIITGKYLGKYKVSKEWESSFNFKKWSELVQEFHAVQVLDGVILINPKNLFNYSVKKGETASFKIRTLYLLDWKSLDPKEVKIKVANQDLFFRKDSSVIPEDFVEIFWNILEKSDVSGRDYVEERIENIKKKVALLNPDEISLFQDVLDHLASRLATELDRISYWKDPWDWMCLPTVIKGKERIKWSINNPHGLLRYVESLIESSYENYDLRMLTEDLFEKTLGNNWYKRSKEIFSRDLAVISKRIIDLIKVDIK